jgi:hypothetical protein
MSLTMFRSIVLAISSVFFINHVVGASEANCAYHCPPWDNSGGTLVAPSDTPNSLLCLYWGLGVAGEECGYDYVRYTPLSLP